MWFVYGVILQESKIWASNGIGLLLGSYYFSEFLRHCPEKSPTLPGSKQQHVQVVAAVMATTLVVAYSLTNPAVWIGRAGVVFCIAMFASPLAALQTVIQQRSARAIPLPFTVASVVNCVAWSVLGWFQMHDVNVYFPNLLGLSFGLIQVALKVVYGDGPDGPLKKGGGAGVVDLPH